MCANNGEQLLVVFIVHVLVYLFSCIQVNIMLGVVKCSPSGKGVIDCFNHG